MEFLIALRQDVEINVRPARKEHGALSYLSLNRYPFCNDQDRRDDAQEKIEIHPQD